MRTLLLALLASVAVHAADERKVALEAAAQVSFERVQAPVTIDLAATVKCAQAQAMLLAVATPEESASLVFRKAFCSLAGAGLTGIRRLWPPPLRDWTTPSGAANLPPRNKELPYPFLPPGEF